MAVDRNCERDKRNVSADRSLKATKRGSFGNDRTFRRMRRDIPTLIDATEVETVA
jgi:hypothetical protein